MQCYNLIKHIFVITHQLIQRISIQMVEMDANVDTRKMCLTIRPAAKGEKKSGRKIPWNQLVIVRLLCSSWTVAN